MKFSKYNIEHKVDNNLLIYNSLTSGILLLEECDLKEYENLKSNLECNSSVLKNELIKGGMILDDHINELELIKYISNSTRFGFNGLGLTIAPTLGCNFVCPYCYEKGVTFKTMNNETKSNLIKFIRNNLNKDEPLYISWYGGEPLLSSDIIESLSADILNIVDSSNYFADMVTNGYLLTREIAQKLKKINVSNLQITIDGPPEIHDSRRKLASGEGSFYKIIENIKNCYDLLDITIRVNIDQSNKDYIEELVEILKKENVYDKVFLYIAKVDDFFNKNNPILLDNKEFSKFNNSFIDKNKVFNSIPHFNPGICGAVNSKSFVVSPDGSLYKCWDEIGRKDLIIGTLENGVTYNDNLFFYTNFNPFSDEKCLNCNVLPICMGGCPYQKKLLGSASCSSQKDTIIKQIEIAYFNSL